VLVARIAVIAWFALTDYSDGDFARVRGLDTSFGGWIDHLGDWAFALTVLWLGISDSSFRTPRPRRPAP